MLLNEWINSQSLGNYLLSLEHFFFSSGLALRQSLFMSSSWLFLSPQLLQWLTFLPLPHYVFSFQSPIALLKLIKVNEPHTNQPQALSFILYLPFLFSSHFPSVIPKTLNYISAILTWHLFLSHSYGKTLGPVFHASNIIA